MLICSDNMFNKHNHAGKQKSDIYNCSNASCITDKICIIIVLRRCQGKLRLCNELYTAHFHSIDDYIILYSVL